MNVSIISLSAFITVSIYAIGFIGGAYTSQRVTFKRERRNGIGTVYTLTVVTVGRVTRSFEKNENHMYFPPRIWHYVSFESVILSVGLL